MYLIYFQFSSVQSLSRVWLLATPWITARQASLSITNSRSSLRLTSIESVMPSSHLILCHPLLLLPPISPSIRVFSNESALRMRWPKYWSFSFSISVPLWVFPYFNWMIASFFKLFEFWNLLDISHMLDMWFVNFLPLWSLIFYPLCIVFFREEVFNFHEVQIMSFSFCAWCSWCLV